MFTAKSIHTKIAFKAIQEYLLNRNMHYFKNEPVPDELNIKRSCFVTIKTEQNKLRGCIGTIYPVYENLYNEIIKNAVSSAFFDNRFSPLTLSETEHIKISVEVLSTPEKIEQTTLLNPKIYGAIIKDKNNRTGVLLPGIEGIETIEEQIKIIKKKAGIFQTDLSGLTIYRFTTDKFY
jgi:AmmeMemoRadiSam system protein A